MEPIDKLIAGYRRFRDRHASGESDYFTRLAAGQSPAVAIVACCDSRVDPALITDSDPGDIFVIRNVANLVPPFEQVGCFHGTSAALEFAVTGLGVGHIIVLAHARCAGVQALLEGQGGDFIADWMSIAEEVREAVLADPALVDDETRARACEQAALHTSLANLRTFPWIAERLAAGDLTLHGWYFDLAQGALLTLDARERFVPVT